MKENKTGLNIFMLSILLIALGVMGWWAIKAIPPAIAYSMMFIISIVAVFLSLILFKDTKIEEATKRPFTTNNRIAVIGFLAGLTIPIIVKLLASGIGSKFSFTTILAPLSANSLAEGIGQSFSVAQATGSAFFSWFSVVFASGAGEEFIFGFATMVVGYILAKLVLTLINGNEDIKIIKKETFYFIFALIFSIALFTGAHVLNSTYTSIGAFIGAAVFRGILNIFIYRLGIALAVTTGFHMSVNAIWFYETFGAQRTVEALLSIGGVVIILPLFALILVYTIRNFGKFIDDIKR